MSNIIKSFGVLVLSKEVRKEVFFYCPVCKKTYAFSIDLGFLEKAEGGITSIPIEHGVPPHLVIVEVDTEGMVRGVRVLKEAIKPIEKLPKIDFIDLVKKLGSKLLGVVSFWYLTGKEIQFTGKNKEKVRLATVYRDYLESLIGKLKGGKIVINLENPQIPLISIDPLIRIFEFIESGKIRIADFWVQREIKRFKEGVDFLGKLCESGATYKKKDLLEKMGKKYRYDEIIMMIEIVRYMDCDVDSVFDVKEIKVKRLLEL